MKTDFEKLKKLCDENGFELITESPDENDKFFVVKKKDERVKVEFEEVIGSWDNYYLVCFDFTLNKKFDDLDKNGLLEKAGEYLKQHLENFLNENYEQKQ